MRSHRWELVLAVVLVSMRALAAQPAPADADTLLENPFQLSGFLQDTNGDKVPDAICGYIVVPEHPTEEENAAAANLAARFGYETSALSLPLVVSGAAPAPHKGCTTSRTLWIDAALPAEQRAKLAPWLEELGLGEGGIYAVDGGLTIQAHDAVGLLAAADALAARAPFAWQVPGPKLDSIAKTINSELQKSGLAAATAQLAGITYLDHVGGIHEALITVSGVKDVSAVTKAFKPEDSTAPLRLEGVREAQVLVDGTPVTLTGTANPPSAGLPSAPPADEAGRSFDLAQLYTIKGLLTGSAKKPIPSGVDAKLYIPAGQQGVALANLAARLGLETVGITLPVAEPASGVKTSQVNTVAIIGGDNELSNHLEDLLSAPGNADLAKMTIGEYRQSKAAELPALAPGEGELRTVDHAFGKQGALLIRGDEQGSVAAERYAAGHLPYLWEPNKRYASLEEMRDDMRHFFSLRSSIGQTAASLYLLDQWLDQLKTSENGKKLDSITAEVDVDEADPKLKAYIQSRIAAVIPAAHIEVKTGSLHAGLKCCAAEPPLHRDSEIVPFEQAKPTLAEDIVIPWEGKRLIEAVQSAASNLPADQDVVLEARVSEGPEERTKLEEQIRTLLEHAGASAAHLHVQVLCAYKQGYSWLLDAVTPQLKAQPVDHIEIQFSPYTDPAKLSSLESPSRWVQELYPVDEMMAKQLGLPLNKISFKEMADAKGPTYRARAFAADGHVLLDRSFTVALAARTYSEEFPNYDHVNVETGWVRLAVAGKTTLDQRIETDTEMFWDHYQTKTLPAIYRSIMAQNDGRPKVEYQPLFDTLRISFHLSEPDYNIGLDQERISSLEALQEDALFSTENFFYMLGDSEATEKMDYMGRIIPVAYRSVDGQDGHVRIEYYAKDAAHPMVRLAWRETANGAEQERKRDLPVVHIEDPRLVAARLRDGVDGVESLTWRLRVDAKEDKFEAWRKLVPEEQLEHTALFADECRGELAEVEKLHAAGLYQNELAYPHLRQLDFEFALPLGFHPPESTKPEIVTAEIPVSNPLVPRPQITDFKPASLDAQGHFVQWEHPIGPAESASLLFRLSLYPGVNVYWMGRTYLGKNIWAADIMLPSPSALHSMAKETTLKAAIIYSGRQHSNEVSSTSHLFRLAEQLVTDPSTRASLDKVNVVLHPITNVDGAELAMDLAKITPENMLHAGYHGSLTADVVTAQWDKDTIYPESRTRAQLWQAWLPDAFLNPHGYPSHEWVQPFSEYAAWVITRTQAEAGRAWWIPRGWFTSLNYLKDPDHPESETVTLALRDYIVNNMVQVPHVLDMNAKMNARYHRYGQQWDQRDFQQPVYKGVRIYMAQTGTMPAASAQSFLARYPDVTYDDGYTEAPDETAYGDWLKLVASAGLAYDRAHLQYLTDAKMHLKRTQKEFFDGVNWKVDRERPMLPADIDQLDRQK